MTILDPQALRLSSFFAPPESSRHWRDFGTTRLAESCAVDNFTSVHSNTPDRHAFISIAGASYRTCDDKLKEECAVQVG